MKYLGILYDKYTPPIESQITKDLIAFKYYYGNDITVCTKNPNDIARALAALRIKVISDISLPKVFIVYKTGEEFPETPDNCQEIIERDFYVDKANIELTSDPENDGYFLPEYGKPYISNMSRLHYRPNGYVPIDPSIRLLWG